MSQDDTTLYNKYSDKLIKRDYVTPRCNRAKLDTGTFCNYDCEFCYYQGLLHIKTDFETIRNRADKLHEYGIVQVDLSGGESSVHKDWFKILNYCNNKFEHISTLTNGWAFSDENFLIKSKNAGLKEIMFSVHGMDEKNHDHIVRRRGAWNKIHKAIKNAHKHNLIVRVNCTIYQKNIEKLPAYADILKEIKPLEVNFLTLNYWTNNDNADPIDYKYATDNIKRCIDNIKDHIKYINVRYTPFCYMVGYEKYVCNQFQHIYDIFDWNKEIYSYNLDTSIDYTEKQKIDMAYEQASIERNKAYNKPIECLKCKFYNICDGVEKQVKNFKPLPVSGARIRDVTHYRKHFYV